MVNMCNIKNGIMFIDKESIVSHLLIFHVFFPFLRMNLINWKIWGMYERAYTIIYGG